MYNLEKLQHYSSIDACGTKLFDVYLANILNEYEKLVPKILLEYHLKDNDTIINLIKDANSAILKVVVYSLQGKHLLAYKTLLEYVNNHIPPICHEEANNRFYRMRVFEDKRSRERQELFHIPFHKQGKVKTQMYSMPGLPCLYLGTSLYGCWEELNRPPLFSCMFSQLTNTEVIKLWDFRIPKEVTNEEEMKKLLLAIPLIISCSIKANNTSDDFKPEYIVPQMMLGLLSCSDDINMLYGKKTQNIMGIKYSSVMANNDFGFPNSKCDNIVIPAFRTNYEYDERLCNLFIMTEPTCEEFEKIRYHKSVLGCDTTHEDSYTYFKSLFGELEYYISDTDAYPPLKVDNKPLQNDIERKS